MPTTSSGRWLTGMVVGVIAIAIIAIVVTIFASSGDPELLPVGSPEAKIQDFVLAIDDGAFDVAHAMLSPEVGDGCSLTDFRRYVRDGQQSGLRVELENINVYGELADVTVNVSSFSGTPPFDFSENKHETYFALERTGEAWAITQAPWPFTGCPFVPLQAKPTPAPTDSQSSVLIKK